MISPHYDEKFRGAAPPLNGFESALQSYRDILGSFGKLCHSLAFYENKCLMSLEDVWGEYVTIKSWQEVGKLKFML